MVAPGRGNMVRNEAILTPCDSFNTFIKSITLTLALSLSLSLSLLCCFILFWKIDCGSASQVLHSQCICNKSSLVPIQVFFRSKVITDGDLHFLLGLLLCH